MSGARRWPRRGPVPGVGRPSWADAATRYRNALEMLGWSVPHCLPDEAGACGAGDAEHAAGYLGVIQALIEGKLAHLHGGEHIAAASYAETVAELAELEAMRPCGREH